MLLLRHPEQLSWLVVLSTTVAACAFFPAIVHADASSTLNDVKESLKNVHDTIVEDFMEKSTLAGKISPVFSKIILTKEQRGTIWQGITNIASTADIVLLLLLGYAVVPIVEVPYTRFIMSRNTKNDEQEFRHTTVYHILETLSQIARLAFVVYAFDLIKISVVGAGFDIPRQERMTHAFAYVLYVVWGASRVSKLKQFLLEEVVGRGDTKGRMQVVDRFGNFFLAIIAIFMILDVLNVEMGLATRGAVAFGSVGTLMFSLAAKDTVANMLHGIILSASDRIYEGDSIRLHKSGFSGSVHKLGWLETVLRGSDEVMVTIPNADLLSQRVCNLSRIDRSQVKQTLQFSYEDSEKLPQLSQDIKSEIRATCPTVITDGSRPFRCYWTSYQSNHLEVTVEAYFRIKPIGDAYHENRQRVLQAIHRAVKKNNINFKL